MKQVGSFIAGCIVLAGAFGAAASEPVPRGFGATLPVTHFVAPVAAGNAKGPANTTAVKPLPMWSFSVTASPDLGGGSYSGSMIGQSPHAAVKGLTLIQAQIVPLVITINDGTSTVVYDPTQPDPCNGNRTAVHVVWQSPMFTRNTTYTMNGVNVGQTQYIDAYQRANFWQLVGGSNYHLLFGDKLLPAQKMLFSGAANGTNLNAATAYGGCGNAGIVNIYDLDNRIEALITGPLAGMVNAGTFPIFVIRNVVFSANGASLANCCVLGYHSGMMVGPNLQVYLPFAVDTSHLFSTDVNILSHEMAEAVTDPYGGNVTPSWGDIGQVQKACQNSFEVGDPLTKGYPSPTNPFVVQGANGVTYHLQELAFFDWFFGGPSISAGGMYSNNGTFAGDARLCSLGGGTH